MLIWIVLRMRTEDNLLGLWIYDYLSFAFYLWTAIWTLYLAGRENASWSDVIYLSKSNRTTVNVKVLFLIYNVGTSTWKYFFPVNLVKCVDKTYYYNLAIFFFYLWFLNLFYFLIYFLKKLSLCCLQSALYFSVWKMSKNQNHIKPVWFLQFIIHGHGFLVKCFFHCFLTIEVNFVYLVS